MAKDKKRIELLKGNCPKGESMMKRSLTGIASVGILAVTVGVETANAQSYRRYGPARTRSAHCSVFRPEQSGSHRRW